MIRPLALIEGNLALPELRPFDGLPPPFGTRRREPRPPPPRARQSKFPPHVKHVLLYPISAPRQDTHRFDTAMAEAKRYLEMGKTRPRSSRSDYMLGAVIVTGCSIALAWLMVSCSMRDAEKAKAQNAVSIVQAVTNPTDMRSQQFANIQSTRQAAAATASTVPATKAAIDPTANTAANAAANRVAESRPLAMAASPTVQPQTTAPAPPTRSVERSSRAALSEPSAIKQQTEQQAVPSFALKTQRATRVAADQRAASQDVPKQSAQPAQPAKPLKKARASVARLTEAQLESRITLNRATAPASRATLSRQPEWTNTNPMPGNQTKPSARSDDAGAPWLNGSVQQSARQPSTRTTVSTDNDNWSSRMAQRRITDNPDAFQTDLRPVK